MGRAAQVRRNRLTRQYPAIQCGMSTRHDRIVRILTGLNYKAIYAILFLMAFTLAIIGGVSGGLCASASSSERRIITYCTMSLTVLTPFPGRRA